MRAADPEIGLVAIGRDEGERLPRCLRSALSQTARVLYVDSGSSDGSVARAKALGVEALELDPSRPFSAARARNEGFDRLTRTWPDLAYVQFLDGDCELRDGWLEAARSYLHAHPDVAVVCGRLRERHPGASVYNRLADMEWNLGVGADPYCGGNAAVAAAAFREHGWFDPTLIAGEEPELCLRLRREGLRVVAIDHEMALHDSAMFHFRQWWRRTVRAGHAFAEGAYLHGSGARRVASILVWGAALPAASLVLAAPTLGGSAAFLSLYGVLWHRLYKFRRGRSDGPDAAALYATATMVGKVPEAVGVASFAWNRLLRGRRTRLIEHRKAEGPPRW